MSADKKSVYVSVDRKVCIGCNLCCEVAGEVFFMKGDKSQIKKGANLSDLAVREHVELAAMACASGAIKIKLKS